MKLDRVSIWTPARNMDRLVKIFVDKGFIHKNPALAYVRNKNPYIHLRADMYFMSTFSEAKGTLLFHVLDQHIPMIELLPKEAIIEFIQTLPTNRNPKKSFGL